MRTILGVAGAALVSVVACAGNDDPIQLGSTSGAPTSSGTIPGGSSGNAPCGSPGAAPCADAGGVCSSDAECENRCVTGACSTPTHADGKKSPSLGETDVDCGGATAPACAEGKGCAADLDCTTGACGAAGTCVSAPSCKGKNGPAGIETCGAGETGEAGAAHESCCRSLPLPTSERRLDRYEITAGRLRAFVSGVTEATAGVPNLRAFVTEYVAAHPQSQLGKLAAQYPGLIDILPDHAGPNGAFPLPVHLGAFPMDPINTLDGCFTSTNAYGHGVYWQPPEDVATYNVGNAGVRVYSREILDEKPVNCVMPILLAAFCAWDGGELARTADYRAIWGRNPKTVGAQQVMVPWTDLLRIGQFNWRNGHGGACAGLADWPGGCRQPQPAFYGYPAGGNPANDDTPAIGAPGRFTLDVTAAKSATGEGWLDVGGNLMEAAWPNGPVDPAGQEIEDVCDATGGGGDACPRAGGGVRRYTGKLQHVALVGYSFEGHSRRSEAYLAAANDDESLLKPGDLKPVSFQYGKVGGRCARPAP